MAIDVLIKQKLFGNRTMPLDLILGEHLHYGNYVNDQLNPGELGETEFVAYNPGSIGRGFSVVWTPGEKKTIALRLPMPSTKQELRDFYDTVARMVSHWDRKLTVDGNRVKLPDFLAAYDDMVVFNNKTLKHLSRQVLDGTHDTLTLYSAMWPLAIGKEEASLFLDDPDAYAQWLHKKQSMDVYFESPSFYAGDQGVWGRYILTDNLPAVFPYQPTVPFGATDPATGKPLECKDWRICLGLEGETEPLCEMEYFKFLDLIPKNKQTRYDGGHFLLSELTEEEIRAIALQAFP